jgi:hypothetical protein
VRTFDGGMYALTSHGVMYEDTDGWRLLCEELSPVDETTFVRTETTWVLGTTVGLLVSADGCDWTDTLPDMYVGQLHLDDDGVLWAATAGFGDLNGLRRSSDGGLSFVEAFTQGEGASIRNFATEGDAWYLLGWEDGSSFVWVSMDGGDNWERHALDLMGGHLMYALGIDAVGRLLMRMPMGPGDRVVRISADGTAEQLVETDSGAWAFDQGPDDSMYVGAVGVGVYGSVNGGATWADPVEPRLRCMATVGDDRVGCTDFREDLAGLIRTDLAATDPSTWEWELLAGFDEVKGMRQCPQGTGTFEVCEPLWQESASSLGVDLGSVQADTDDTDVVDEPSCGCRASPMTNFWLPVSLLLVVVRRKNRK